MFKNYLGFLSILLFVLVTTSCSEDDNYVPVVIETNNDIAQVAQNAFVDIDVLSNDANVPESCSLTAASSQNGTVEVLDVNNTPNNPSDDIIRYSPDEVFVGEDSFDYEICDGSNNCGTGTVTVTVTPVSPVSLDLANMPYNTLSEYNFFEGDLKELNPVYGVLPYDLNSPLFSDYAHKKRFVWMPEGTKANYNSDFTPLDFPLRSVIIKNFYYDNVQPTGTTRIIETRLMYMTTDGWEFAKYVWNDEQTEATFTNAGSFTDVEWIENGITKNVTIGIARTFPISPYPAN